MKMSKESRVPSSRISRLSNFGMLAVGLGMGAASEVTRRALGISQTVGNPYYILFMSQEWGPNISTARFLCAF